MLTHMFRWFVVPCPSPKARCGRRASVEGLGWWTSRRAPGWSCAATAVYGWPVSGVCLFFPCVWCWAGSLHPATRSARSPPRRKPIVQSLFCSALVCSLCFAADVWCVSRVLSFSRRVCPGKPQVVTYLSNL